jgi:hypothetical protein
MNNKKNLEYFGIWGDLPEKLSKYNFPRQSSTGREVDKAENLKRRIKTATLAENYHEHRLGLPIPSKSLPKEESLL